MLCCGRIAAKPFCKRLCHRALASSASSTGAAVVPPTRFASAAFRQHKARANQQAHSRVQPVRMLSGTGGGQPPHRYHQLRVFRSLWGAEEVATDWAELFPLLKAKGIDGVEASLGDIETGGGTEKFRALLDKHGLKCIVGIYSGWQDYEGPWHPTSVEQHADQFEAQLQQALELKPLRINSHSGCDSWCLDDGLRFFEHVQRVEKDLLGGKPFVGHETHRGRVFSNPFTTGRVLDSFPDLCLTADLSHWMVVCERVPLNNDDIVKFAARTIHVHARVGTPQAPQVTKIDQKSDVYRFYRKFWDAAYTANMLLRDEDASVCVEYGPAPYNPSNPNGSSFVSAFALSLEQANLERAAFESLTT